MNDDVINEAIELTLDTIREELKEKNRVRMREYLKDEKHREKIYKAQKKYYETHKEEIIRKRKEKLLKAKNKSI